MTCNGQGTFRRLDRFVMKFDATEQRARRPFTEPPPIRKARNAVMVATDQRDLHIRMDPAKLRKRIDDRRIKRRSVVYQVSEQNQSARFRRFEDLAQLLQRSLIGPGGDRQTVLTKRGILSEMKVSHQNTRGIGMKERSAGNELQLDAQQLNREWIHRGLIVTSCRSLHLFVSSRLSVISARGVRTCGPVRPD